MVDPNSYNAIIVGTRRVEGIIVVVEEEEEKEKKNRKLVILIRQFWSA